MNTFQRRTDNERIAIIKNSPHFDIINSCLIILIVLYRIGIRLLQDFILSATILIHNAKNMPHQFMCQRRCFVHRRCYDIGIRIHDQNADIVNTAKLLHLNFKCIRVSISFAGRLINIMISCKQHILFITCIIFFQQSTVQKPA